MSKKTSADIPSLMMLIWLAFYIFAVFYASRWADFILIIACAAPMVIFKKQHRGATFGSKDGNVFKYKFKEYALSIVFCICGCAFISAVTFLLFKHFGMASTASLSRADFPYLLVFSCFIPAFFEEWLVRGGVLGAVAERGGAGVWFCSIVFMLMHADASKWPYALFAGVCITSIVYLCESIYVGMVLHFLNNFTSLLLSYLPNAVAEYVALAIITVILIVSFMMLKKCNIYRDAIKVLSCVDKGSLKELFSPAFLIFAVVMLLSMCGMLFGKMLPSQ